MKQKRIIQWLEAFGFSTIFAIFGALPLDAASALGGFIGRIIGAFVPVAATAKRNLDLAFPDMPDKEKYAIMRGMWNNLGRYAAEFPHMAKDKIATRVTLIGKEHIERIKSSGKGSLWISGHFGNWEIMPRMSAEYGVPLMLVYRHSNNPIAERMVQKVRARYNNGMFGKGGAGAMRIMRALKQNQAVGILIDQKMNEGIPVPFFGHDVMTSDAFAQMALRLQIPVILAFVRRTNGAHFELDVQAPIYLEGASDNQEDVKRAVGMVYERFEQWIRKHPSQWFWVHRRWPKEIYRE